METENKNKTKKTQRDKRGYRGDKIIMMLQRNNWRPRKNLNQ